MTALAAWSDRKKSAANTKRSPFAIAELNKILQVTSKLSQATADKFMGHLIAGTAGIYGNSKPEPVR